MVKNKKKNMVAVVIAAAFLVVGVYACNFDKRLMVMCRHKALMAMMILAESFDTEVVVGKCEVSKGLHAVARANIDDEWQYFTVSNGIVVRIAKPRMIEERALGVDEYLKLIRRVIIVSRYASEVESFNKYLYEKGL